MAQPTALYSVAQVRAFDDHAIQESGVPGYMLMQRAGAAAFGVLYEQWPRARCVVVVCGSGNNGGDGYVVARLAAAAGLVVSVLSLVDVARLTGAARQAADDFLAAGGRAEPWAEEALAGADVIVDAILGTGARAPLRGLQAAAIAAINSAVAPVLALDVPSGLDGDTGATIGDAIHASCTVSFIALKQGLFLGNAPALTGRVMLEDLDVILPTGAASEPAMMRLTDADIRQALPPRRHDAHKGDFGRVLIIGGGPGMPGAVRLAGEASLRVGAGLVTIATVPEHAVALAAARPELICIGINNPQDLGAQLAATSVIAIGPGLGQSTWAQAMLAAALRSTIPLVVDADALNLLAAQQLVLPARALITPHPGEAGRLLQCAGKEIQRDRVEALRRLVVATGAVVVLKGSGTLVGAAGKVTAVCESGNPGMAVAGMGDVLTGAIAGIYAQCGDPWLAARAGVLIHARAGDQLASRVGGRGLMAQEVAIELTAVLRESAT